MTTMKWLQNALLTGLIAVGCYWALAYLQKAGDPSMDNQAANGQKYVLDFSNSPNRGIRVGKFHNFGFRIDLKNAVKNISVPLGNRRLPDLVATFDYAGCMKGQEFLLESAVRELPPGDAAWVDEVEVVMVSSLKQESRGTSGICYGVREAGKWYWNFTSTPLTYDSAANSFRARIAVKRGPIDAIKLVFGQEVPPLFLTNLSFTTRPISSKPDPVYSPPARPR